MFLFSPNKGKFNVKSYTITIQGFKGALKGKSGKISGKHISILKKAKPGSQISISCMYSGTKSGILTNMHPK
jgi:hypothetical protein